MLGELPPTVAKDATLLDVAVPLVVALRGVVRHLTSGVEAFPVKFPTIEAVSFMHEVEFVGPVLLTDPPLFVTPLVGFLESAQLGVFHQLSQFAHGTMLANDLNM